jgi:hypothetical protein
MKKSYLKSEDYQYFIESLILLYVQKHVGNMFRATVIEQMSKKINYTEEQITEML